jgi:hypothetical protein
MGKSQEAPMAIILACYGDPFLPSRPRLSMFPE